MAMRGSWNMQSFLRAGLSVALKSWRTQLMISPQLMSSTFLRLLTSGWSRTTRRCPDVDSKVERLLCRAQCMYVNKMLQEQGESETQVRLN